MKAVHVLMSEKGLAGQVKWNERLLHVNKCVRRRVVEDKTRGTISQKTLERVDDLETSESLGK
jgi:hypothetical protein